MVLWNEIKVNDIELVKAGKEDGKWKYKIDNKSLRFQVPRGLCKWGVGMQYKSLVVDIGNTEFLNWWKTLEQCLCPHEPFVSNLKGNSLRMKIDDSTYVFDENAKQYIPELCDGLFKGQDLSCLIQVESNYFFQEKWGLTVKVVQIKHYGEVKVGDEEVADTVSLKECAFI